MKFSLAAKLNVIIFGANSFNEYYEYLTIISLIFSL